MLAASFDSSGRRIETVGADGTLRTYDCEICGGAAELVKLGAARLVAPGTLTPAERRGYFGG